MDTRSALVIALADLLIEAHAREQGSPLREGRHDEPKDHC
jgi:predicted nucleic acid-binding protein